MSSIEVNYNQKRHSFMEMVDNHSDIVDDRCLNCMQSNQNLVLELLSNSPFQLKNCFIK